MVFFFEHTNAPLLLTLRLIHKLFSYIKVSGVYNLKKMLPALPQLFAGILSIASNYVATFYMPKTQLLRDPLETLTTAIPLVLACHIIILIFMLSVVKRCNFKTTVV